MPDYEKSFINGHFDTFSSDNSEFDLFYKKLTGVLSPEFISYLQTYAEKSLLSKKRAINVSFAIDANIIYREIYAIMKGRPSFLSSFITNPIITLYAPDQIDAEVQKTIDEDLPKTLNKDRAKSIAIDLLSKVKKVDIPKDMNNVYYRYAYQLIGTKDKSGPTDAQYLAVAFLLKTHGAISKDDIFNKQSEVKVWKLGTAGKVVSELTSGSLSISIIESGYQFVGQILYYIFSVFLQIVKWIQEGLIAFIVSLVTGGIEFISKLPDDVKEAIVIGGVFAGLLYLLSDKFRGFVSEGIETVKEVVINTIKEIKTHLIEFVELIRKAFEWLYPYVEFAFKAIGFMFSSVYQMNTRLDELASTRSHWGNPNTIVI